MNNVKKLLAVLIVVTMLVTAMIPVMAADTFSYEDEATVLADLGLMIGDGEDMDLDSELTREMGAVLLVRLLGAEEDALALTDAEITAALKDYTDNDDISFWAEAYVAYATEAGYLTGRDDGSLDPKANLLGKDYCTMILRAMGYEVDAADWAIAASLLVEVDGLSTAEAIKFNDKALIRDAAAGITYAALSGEVADGGSLIAALVAAGAVDADDAIAAGLIEKPAATPLTVESLSATNLKEIVVNFNKALDKASAETATNYTLSTGGPVTKAVMNGNSVTLTVTGPIANQTKVSVTVSASVKSADGVAIVATTKDITMFDVTIPVALSYAFTGPQTIEVTFSEPINAAGSALVDNGIYGTSVAVHATKNNVAVVTLGTALPEGTHTLKVSGTTDFVPYIALDKVFDITYVKDTTLPVASLSSVTQTKATIKFSKEVKGLSLANFYHTYTAYTPDSVKDTAGADVVPGNFYDTVVVTFQARPIPSGTTNVVVLKTVGSVSVTDRYGNVMGSDAVLAASVATDTVAPTITKVEATAENKVVITYSESVINADAKANYVFKKADGSVIAASAYGAPSYVEGTTYTATILFSPALAGGAYSVEVSNIKDASLSANPMGTVALGFNVTDKTAISSATTIVIDNAAATSDIIYITYPEAMATTGANSVLELANYKIGTAGSAYAAVALPTGTKIEVFGTSNRVKITLPAASSLSNTDLAGKKLFVRNLADASGNVLTNLFIEIALTADTAPQITKVKSIAKNTFELYVNKELSALNAVNITKDGVPVAQATYVNKTDGTSIITVVVPAAQALANEGVVLTSGFAITNGGLIKSITGTPMVADTNVFVDASGLGSEYAASFVDGVAPAVYKIELYSPTSIKITFTEDLNAGTIAAAGKNGFSVIGGTLTSALRTGANEITLTGTSFTVDTDVYYNGTNGILDNSDPINDTGNALAAISRTAVLTTPEF